MFPEEQRHLKLHLVQDWCLGLGLGPQCPFLPVGCCHPTEDGGAREHKEKSAFCVSDLVCLGGGESL